MDTSRPALPRPALPGGLRASAALALLLVAVALLTGPLAALPPVALTIALLLGRLPRVALTAAAMGLLLIAVGATVPGSHRPHHPLATHRS